MKIKLSLLSAIILFGVAVIIILTVPMGESYAASCTHGTGTCRAGSFSSSTYGQGTTGFEVLKNGFYPSSGDVSYIISRIKGCLYDTACDYSASYPIKGYDRSAAFIVLSMLPDSTKPYTVQQAKDRFTEWSNLVKAYNDAGLIKYNYEPTTWPSNTKGVSNSVNGYDVYNPPIADIIHYSETVDSSTPGGTEAVAFMDPDNPSDVLYAIRKYCGNPVGALKPLKKPDKKPTGSASYVCKADGSAVVSYKFEDADQDGDDTRGYTHLTSKAWSDLATKYNSEDNVTSNTLAGWGWDFHSYAGTNTPTETVSADKTDGTLYAWVYAQDLGPGGDHDYYKVAITSTKIKCNHPPQGNITNIQCVVNTGELKVTFKAWDDDDTGGASAQVSYAENTDGEKWWSSRYWVTKDDSTTVTVPAGNVNDGTATRYVRLYAYDNVPAPAANGTTNILLDSLAVPDSEKPCAPNHPPTGSVSVACTTDNKGVTTYKFSYSFSDSDGRSGAAAAGYLYRGSDSTYKNLSGTATAGSPFKSGSGTWTETGSWPGYDADGGYHYIWLRVADIYPDGTHKWVNISDADGGAAREPTCWHLEGSTSVPTSAYVGQDIKIDNYVKNFGKNAATYTWTARWCLGDNSANQSCGSNPHETGDSGSVSGQGVNVNKKVDSWTWTVPDVTKPQACFWIHYSDAEGPGTADSWGSNVCVQIKHPIPQSCNVSFKQNGATVDPNLIEPDYPFTVITDVPYQDNTAASVVWGAGGRAFYRVGSGSNTTGGKVDGSSITGSFNAAALGVGKYTIYGGVTGSTITGSNKTCNSPITIAYHPYVNFFGNDVFAGGAFTNSDGTCGTPSDGDILTWLDNAKKSGSGSQFATLSEGSIDGFGSAMMRTGAPTPLTGLMFSNTSSGQLGTSHCIPDYYDSKDKLDPTSTGSSFTIWGQNAGSAGQTSTNGAYAYSGTNLTINSPNLASGGGVGMGKNIVIYASGNVTITSSIIYYGGSSYWDSLDKIPSLYIIAKGDINIAPSVGQLDGVYIAQNGTINTCANSDGSHAGYDDCNSQLTVNGAFIDSKTDLYRTFSTLSNSLRGEYPTNTVPSGSCHFTSASPRPATAKNYDCAAEIFNFSPEIYLSSPAIPPLDSGAAKFDSIQSLSPVL